MKQRLLLITNDVIGDTVAGPGIRYVELGSRLAAKGYEITVLGKSPFFATPPPFHYGPLVPVRIIKALIACDCVVIRGGGPLTTLVVVLLGLRKTLIADLYAFTHLEVRHLAGGTIAERYVIKVRELFHVEKMRLYAKFFDRYWVACDRQRDFLHGLLFMAGAIGKAEEIAIVPFGYPLERPRKGKRVLRGVVPGIEADDFILIWGGGVWDWLDPITLVKAMAHLWERAPRIRLYFMGIQAPSGYLPAKAKELLGLCREQGILNKNVFINTGWTAYDERVDYLLEADVGVSLHPPSLETHYSFRTRNLDYVYCGLPMVHAEGDVWAEMIVRHSLGIVVPPEDVQAVHDAILRLFEDTQLRVSLRTNVEGFYDRFTWDTIMKTAVESIERPVTRSRHSLLPTVLTVLLRYSVFGLRSCFALLKIIFGGNRESAPERSPAQ